MDMHNSNLFHTPARSYSGLSPYYTNKFEGTGYTLFEEMMSKICSFVQLDTFAYDDTYQPDHDTYGSAAAKFPTESMSLVLTQPCTLQSLVPMGCFSPRR